MVRRALAGATMLPHAEPASDTSNELQEDENFEHITELQPIDQWVVSNDAGRQSR